MMTDSISTPLVVCDPKSRPPKRSAAGPVIHEHGRSSRRRPVEAVIFDVDGVIADTATLHTMAWRRLAEEEGIEFSPNLADELRGLSRVNSLRRLLGDRCISPECFEELLARKNDYYLDALDGPGPGGALPGVRLLLTGLKELTIKLAAVSLSRNARAVLLRLGMMGPFDAVLDGGDWATGDAETNRFVLAAGRLRTAPAACVVVEDSASGIATALAAGMRCIGLGPSHRVGDATVVLDSFRGVDAGMLLHRLEVVSGG